MFCRSVFLYSPAVLFALAANATASDYNVQFGAPSPNPGQTVNTGSAFSFTPWRSVGDPDGVNLINNTGRTLKALHIKTRRQSDHFTVASPTDNFFLKVWRKRDGREVIYSGGVINATQEFFSKVTRTDDFPEKILDGKLSESDIEPANPMEWELVHDGLKGQDDGWKQFIQNCPSHYRAVDLYAQSKDGSVCFLSKGRLLVFAAPTRSVHVVAQNDVLPGRINRIQVIAGDGKACQFAVYHNGIECGRIQCPAKKNESVELESIKSD